ncbi:hypothetical protein Tco_0935070 [Tanacetum coccineum]
MATLKFADSHNMVAFLSKPAESEGFEQIFWCTVVAKTINGEVQLHALVDGKKIIVTEASVRRDLRLEDEEGIDCLPNSTIFEQLALMGYEKVSQKLTFYKPFFSSQWKFLIHTILQCLSAKTTAWNEFSSTIASAIICLATNQKFNFSKFIFEGSTVPNDPHHIPTIIQPSTSQPQNTQKPRKSKRKDTQVPQPSGPTDIIADEAVHKELDDSLVRAATTASSLAAEQDSGGGPKCQETIGDAIAQTRDENVSKLSNDPLIARGDTLQSGEDSLKLNELMELCTNLQQRVLDLEQTNTSQQNEIDSLKRRVKKLERKRISRTHKLKRLYKVGLSARVESSRDEESLGEDASKQRRINAIDADEDITLVNVQDDVDNEMFDVNALNCEEVFIAGQNENVFENMKKKVQIMLDEEDTLKLQAKFDEEERLAREKAKKEKEANIALIEEWDDIQAKIDADHQLAERLQAQEQEELSDAEKATLFQQLLEKRRKHFAAKRAEERRNKPPTKAQQRQIMCTYLKNMEGYKLKDLKSKGFDYIQEIFDKAFKREIAEVDDDQEAAKIKELMEIIPDEEKVAIDAIPLVVKSPRIGRIVRIKSLLNAVGITAVLIDVNAAQSKLVLLRDLEEKLLSIYYC